MKKYLILIISLIILTSCSTNQTTEPQAADNWEWVVQLGITNEVRVFDMVSDKSGNSYITGFFNGTESNPAVFGEFKLISDAYCAFVAKIDDKGKVLWVDSVSSYAIGIDLCMDNNNNLYSQIQHGQSGRPEKISFIKFDQSGNKIWTKEINTADYWSQDLDEPLGKIRVDGLNNLYYMGGNDDVEKTLIKYNTDGNILMTKSVPLSHPDYYDFEVDSIGNIYYSTTYSNSVSVDSLTVSSSVGKGIAMIKYDVNGNLKYMKNLFINRYGMRNIKLKKIDYYSQTDSSQTLYITGSNLSEMYTDPDNMFNTIPFFGGFDGSSVFIASIVAKSKKAYVARTSGFKADYIDQVEYNQNLYFSARSTDYGVLNYNVNFEPGIIFGSVYLYTTSGFPGGTYKIYENINSNKIAGKSFINVVNGNSLVVGGNFKDNIIIGNTTLTTSSPFYYGSFVAKNKKSL